MAGVLAQLVERLVRNEKVRSSSLLGSTSLRPLNSCMNRFVLSILVVATVLLSGCTLFKRKPAAPAVAASPVAIVTPDNSLSGKVVIFNSVGRFVVMNFPSRQMPNKDQQLFLYRAGLKVGEVRVTGLPNEDNIVADLVSGEAKAGDEVRDR